MTFGEIVFILIMLVTLFGAFSTAIPCTMV